MNIVATSGPGLLERVIQEAPERGGYYQRTGVFIANQSLGSTGGFATFFRTRSLIPKSIDSVLWTLIL